MESKEPEINEKHEYITAQSVERYILRHKIKTLQFMAFMQGMSVGFFIALLLAYFIDKETK